MKKLIVTALLATSTLIAGCSTQTAHINQGGKSTPTYSESQSFYFAGIGQTETVNAAEVCNGAQNVAKTQSVLSGTNILVGIITLGIYTPYTAKVYCK